MYHRRGGAIDQPNKKGLNVHVYTQHPNPVLQQGRRHQMKIARPFSLVPIRNTRGSHLVLMVFLMAC
jgi:hypothetical protein